MFLDLLCLRDFQKTVLNSCHVYKHGTKKKKKPAVKQTLKSVKFMFLKKVNVKNT